MSRRDSPADSPLAVALHGYKREHGLNNYQLGERLGIDIGMISRLITNRIEPTLSTLNRLAKFFQWTAIEYGQVLVYEGWRGRKSPKRKNARRVTHEAESVQDDHGAAR
jgi:transcriptional regulator with XRE-family HTH domain